MTQHGHSDAERELCAVANVRAARLVPHPSGQGLAVRILAVPGRPTADIVADVRAAALRSTGLLIRRDDVHVIEMERADDGPPPADASGTVTDVAPPTPPPPPPPPPEPTPTSTPEPTPTPPPPEPTPTSTSEPTPTPTPAPTPESAPPAIVADDPSTPTIDLREPRPIGHGAAHGGDAPFRSGRVTLDGVLAVRHGLHSTVEVTLHHEGRSRTGSAEGTAASSIVLRLVTEATLAALAQIRPTAFRLAVDTAAVTTAGSTSIALVTLVLLDASHEEVLVGSAVVREVDVHEAIARAALDATNRRLQLQG